LVKQDKKGYFILIKCTIHQKAITIINLYAPNVSASNFIKHTLKDLKAHMDYNTVAMGDFNTLLSPIDRSSKKNQQILEINDHVDQLNLTDVCRIFQSTSAQYAFFLETPGTFSKIS
jgi:exonuclease III